MLRRAVCTPAVIAGSFVAAMIAASPALGFGGNNGTACPTPVGPDVIVGDIQQVTNYTALGGFDAFSIGTTSCNVGNSNLLWRTFGSPSFSNRHPAISQNMFKYKVVNGAGRFEHIGQSWLKHGFFALTENICGCGCNGQGDQVLGVGCSDPYTAARNGSQSGLGPKWQVHSASGWFPDRANPAFSGSVARRLRVMSSDLEPSSASVLFFVEGQYNSQDDAAFGNKNNNASYRQVTVTGGPTEFSIALSTPTTQRAKAGIMAWKAVDPAVTITNIVTPETPIGTTATYPAYDPNCCTTGLVILGAKATSLGGGIWHYEYAVQNQNSDRSIMSFRVPLSGPVNISNIGFHDVDYHSGDGEGSTTRDGTNWAGQVITGVAATEIRWETSTFAANPNANALRWGTLYNFRFDADTPPTSGDVTLGMWKVESDVLGATVIPTPVDPPPACLEDLDGSGIVGTADLLMLINAWGACAGCPADLDGNNIVGTPDLLLLINAWGSCKPI